MKKKKIKYIFASLKYFSFLKCYINDIYKVKKKNVTNKVFLFFNINLFFFPLNVFYFLRKEFCLSIIYSFVVYKHHFFKRCKKKYFNDQFYDFRCSVLQKLSLPECFRGKEKIAVKYTLRTKVSFSLLSSKTL